MYCSIHNCWYYGYQYPYCVPYSYVPQPSTWYPVYIYPTLPQPPAKCELIKIEEKLDKLIELLTNKEKNEFKLGNAK